jgi:DNA-binding transcriptional LysR family regulator
VTLEQLRVFVAVAERQHVTRAAEALHLAQSAVSAAIAALEGRHGTKLFHRVGRGIELTEAGRLFLDEARAVLGRAEMAEAMLADLAGLKRGTLLIQASQTIAGYWLPRRLADFRREHPSIDVKLTICNTAEAAKAVREGAAEIGLVEGEIDEPMLEAREVARDQLVVLVGADHPWSRRERIDEADLREAEWVLRESGSGTRSALEAALRARGVDPAKMRVALELPSNEAVRSAVEAGLGATALSASVAVASLEAGLLHEVAFDLPARSFSIIHHRERHRSEAALAFFRLLGLDDRASP